MERNCKRMKIFFSLPLFIKVSYLHVGYSDVGVCLSESGDLGESGCGLSEGGRGLSEGCGCSCYRGSIPEHNMALSVSVSTHTTQ